MELLSLYESKRRLIQEELIYDFVEGYDCASTQAKLFLIVQGKSIKVTRAIVHEALVWWDGWIGSRRTTPRDC